MGARLVVAGREEGHDPASSPLDSLSLLSEDDGAADDEKVKDEQAKPTLSTKSI
jgi:hypothetical protein